MRRLWRRANSVDVQKAIWALAELALPCERVEAGWSRDMAQRPAVAAVPVLPIN